VWEEKAFGRERRKHMSKTVRILRNERKIKKPNKRNVDKYNFIKILN
jgi:hypothetical protein